MNIFDYLFGNKESEDKIDKTQLQSGQSEKLLEYSDPVEQYVLESVSDLKKKGGLIETKVLEAEAIYLAAFLYMKNDHEIDFDIDYFSEGLLDSIPSKNYQVADKVFFYMNRHYPSFYGISEKEYGMQGYKMNIQLASNYSSYIKKYFIHVHKINSGEDYLLFSSPRNCLWEGGVKSIDSPTQRDIYYKMNADKFELMIPPFNPLVHGIIISKTDTSIKCQSNDGKRTFIFKYKEKIVSENLLEIDMYRNDKGDMVSYHKK